MLKLISPKHANKIAVFLQSICYLMAALAALTIILVVLGRIEVNLNTPTGFFENALLLEQDHTTDSRFLFISLSDLLIHLNTHSSDGEIAVSTLIGVIFMGLASVAPFGYCFLVMARFFGNIAKGNVFISHNASLLQLSGLVLIASALVLPVLNGYVLPSLINTWSTNVISTSVSVNFTELFTGAVLLVMAYVFHYGLYLQDEADHTI